MREGGETGKERKASNQKSQELLNQVDSDWVLLLLLGGRGASLDRPDVAGMPATAAPLLAVLLVVAVPPDDNTCGGGGEGGGETVLLVWGGEDSGFWVPLLDF